MKLTVAVLLLASSLVGCASTNTGSGGVVSIGPDTYMLGGLGGFFDYSSSGVKTQMIQRAGEFCAEKGRNMVLVNSTGVDSGYAKYASAEVQFRCDPK